MRTAAEQGFSTVAVYGDDDANSLHVSRADATVHLPGRGASPYLDARAVIAAATAERCWGESGFTATTAHRCAVKCGKYQDLLRAGGAGVYRLSSLVRHGNWRLRTAFSRRCCFGRRQDTLPVGTLCSRLREQAGAQNKPCRYPGVNKRGGAAKA